MPKIIIIDGIIGWDIYGSKLRRLLAEANGEEIEVQIASPGGFVYDGIEIFNLIRDYSRNINKVTTKLIGLAASMASYIALAGDRVIAEDNSIYMIHNVWSCVCGDYREMEKTASEIEKLTDLLANAYVEKSGKSKTEIRNLMNDETFFYGDEAFKAGFVDEIIDSKSKEGNKDLLLSMANSRIQSCFKTMQESERSKNDLEKAAALLPKKNLNQLNPNDKVNTDTVNVKLIDEDVEKKDINNNLEVLKTMNEKELMAQHPELYDLVMQSGVEKERKRVNAHITLGQKSGATEKMFEYIFSGVSSVDEDVQAEYLSAGMKNNLVDNRNDDNTDTQNTTTDDVMDEAETKEYTNKLLKKRGIK